MAARRSPTKAFLRRLRRRPGHTFAVGLLALGGVWLWSQRPSPHASTALKGVTVVIDPGHGGADPGAVCGGVAEAALTYRTAATLARVLQDRGAKTVFTVRSASLTESGEPRLPRDAAAALSPGRVLQSGKVDKAGFYARADLAAREWDARRGPVVFLSVHYDSRLPDESMRGSHALWDIASGPPSRLAASVARRIARARLCGDFPPSPVSQKLGVIHASRNPVPERVLVECAVLSNAEDRASAQNPVWREAFCNLLADAIEDTFRLRR